MKKNRSIITVLLIVMTVALLGATFYISSLLSSSDSPTQIQKTKAAQKAYTRTVALADNFGTTDSSSDPATLDTETPIPTKTKPLLAQAPTLMPTVRPTSIPVNTLAPTLPIVTPPISPTLSPLLAYKSTSISPTLIPLTNTGGMIDPTKAPNPTTKQVQPTGVQVLPETGWIQTSSILFIVASSLILFSLLF